MKITQLYFEDTAFGKEMSSWAESMGIEAIKYDSKNDVELEQIEGLLLFHENHAIGKSQSEWLSIFEGKQRGISKIDLNGTLSVAASNFSLWLDRNRCKSVLAIGSEELVKNVNMERFLNELKKS
ncbi:MAG: hypothetical protein PHQ74_13505 [Crocinitomicaceae bacterium]|nr:hypothetical protein [Crocinitomicaceae bacterium]